MNRNRKTAARGTALLLAIGLLAGCGQGGAPGATSAQGAAVEGETVSYMEAAELLDPGYTERDLDGSWEGGTAITLSDGGSDISGAGAAQSERGVTITREGTYVVSGTLSNGQIYVETEGEVQLVLDGAAIHCETGPAIEVQAAEKLYLTLAEGSENTLSDGAEYTLAEGEDEPYATLYTKSAMTVNGGGSLTVDAHHLHGIVSKSDLKITGGAIRVTAVGDGIRGKDSVAVCGGEIAVISAGDAIKSNNDSGEGVGWVSIDGGTLMLTAAEGDGIQADSQLQISDGALNIITGGGSANADPDGEEDEDSASTKGLKAATALYIAGGTLDIDALDDSVHSNGSVTITGGTLRLATGDDGVHADGLLHVAGGSVTVKNSGEGLEGLFLVVSGGTVDITATDDGMNAAGDDEDIALYQQDPYMKITGGTITVNAGGDGADSNGGLYVEGGTLFISTLTTGADGALDYENEGIITGGTVAAAGGTGMAVNFGGSSTQPAVMVYYSTAQAAGTEIRLTDADGTEILSYAPANDYQCAVVSSPALAVGARYSLYSGDSLMTEFTVSETISSISADTGESVSGGMGGGRPGNMSPPTGGEPGERPEDFTPPEDGSFTPHERPADGVMSEDGGQRGGGRGDEAPPDAPDGQGAPPTE